MARLSSLFFGLLAALFVSAAPAPSALESRDLLGEIIDALGIGLVTQINATITLDTLVTNILSITFEAQNPLIFELTIDRVTSTAGINGTVYASFDHTFAAPVVVPPLGTANSGTVPNVTLTQGAIASLAIIPLGYLDLLNIDVHVRALTIDGQLGIPLLISDLHQKNVSTTYTLDLS
ncbi:hypothetical protein B0H17DRAFT_1053166 [Mycena rosella]|uniref:Uncharacterized protein n=1 Tax=Mycena rosella TaxID=1033263 RepID=A0AAD7DPV2_MYCRO|nr:hypothetical protein B0H17DRAFT_1053166 [Mycena rosella]